MAIPPGRHHNKSPSKGAMMDTIDSGVRVMPVQDYTTTLSGNKNNLLLRRCRIWIIGTQEDTVVKKVFAENRQTIVVFSLFSGLKRGIDCVPSIQIHAIANVSSTTFSWFLVVADCLERQNQT